MNFRVGFGYDAHRFAAGRELWLGGIKIEHHKGLLGHSDADALIHALCDALLGAANLRDIGYHFPDTLAEFENIDSKILLKKTMELVRQAGYEFGNADCTIVAEQPKINPHIAAMQTALAAAMQTAENNISVKATTNERMGFAGREEGIAVYVIALIYNS